MSEEFRMARVAQLTGVNPATLHYWDKIGFLAPSIAPSHGTGTRRVYSFADIVTITVIRLLREAGVELAQLAPTVDLLQRCADWRGSLVPEFLVLECGAVRLGSGDDLLCFLSGANAGIVFQVVVLRRLVSDLRQKLALQRPQSSSPATSDV